MEELPLIGGFLKRVQERKRGAAGGGARRASSGSGGSGAAAAAPADPAATEASSAGGGEGPAAAAAAAAEGSGGRRLVVDGSGGNHDDDQYHPDHGAAAAEGRQEEQEGATADDAERSRALAFLDAPRCAPSGAAPSLVPPHRPRRPVRGGEGEGGPLAPPRRLVPAELSSAPSPLPPATSPQRLGGGGGGAAGTAVPAAAADEEKREEGGKASADSPFGSQPLSLSLLGGSDDEGEQSGDSADPSVDPSGSSGAVASPLPLLDGNGGDPQPEPRPPDEATFRLDAVECIVGSVPQEEDSSRRPTEVSRCAADAENGGTNGARGNAGDEDAAPAMVEPPPPSSWSCPRCTLVNPPRSRRCGACSERRPVPQSDPSSASLASPKSSSPGSRKRRLSPPPPSRPSGRQPLASPSPKARRCRAKSTPSGRRGARSNKARPAREALGSDGEPAAPPTHGTSPSGLAEETGAAAGGGSDRRATADASRGAAVGAAFRLSTSPFESVLPVPVTAARGAHVADAPRASPPTASSTGAVLVHGAAPASAASAAPSCRPAESPAPEALVRQMQERFEMESRWFRGRISEGERAVEQRRAELGRAEAELRRARGEWRAFRAEYYAFRNRQLSESPGQHQPSDGASSAVATSFTPAASSPDQQPVLPPSDSERPTPLPSFEPATSEPMPSSSATKAARRGSPISPNLLGRSTDPRSGRCPLPLRRVTSLKASPKREDGSSDPPQPLLNSRESSGSSSAASITSQVLQLAASKRQQPAPSWQHSYRRSLSPLRRSLSQPSPSPPLESPAVADSQATIDPDLDPRYAYLRNRLNPAPVPSPPVAHRTYISSVDHLRRASEEASTDDEPSQSQDRPKDGTDVSDPQALPTAVPHESSLPSPMRGKPHPLSAATNKAPASTSSLGVAGMNGWDSTKPSRDFVAPRAPRPAAAHDIYRNTPGTAAIEAARGAAAAATTGEWIQVAKRARQDQRDRTKARRDALWDDESQHQQPRQPRPDGDPKYAYQEVVRCKALRQELPCHDCYSCRAFYAALPPEDALALLRHSRHRAQHSPSETPRDFWVSDFVDEVEKEREEEELARRREPAKQEE